MIVVIEDVRPKIRWVAWQRDGRLPRIVAHGTTKEEVEKCINWLYNYSMENYPEGEQEHKEWKNSLTIETKEDFIKRFDDLVYDLAIEMHLA
jgi:hypothetical protein